MTKQFKAVALEKSIRINSNDVPNGTYRGAAYNDAAIAIIDGYEYFFRISGYAGEGPCRITAWNGEITIQMEDN